METKTFTVVLKEPDTPAPEPEQIPRWVDRFYYFITGVLVGLAMAMALFGIIASVY